ncbi:MAG TPA: cytochrome c oxidase subunit 3 [Tepidiformaceae bacterium]|jgi:cytochrome c oxidase subunit 3
MAAHGTTQARPTLSNGMLGLILFIASEVMFFGGLFAAYFIARADAPAWPPEEFLTPEQIAAGVELHLEVLLPAIATLILITSSVTMQIGVGQIQKGNRSGLIWMLFITMVLGLVFLSIQMYDYSQLPFGASDTIYGTTFYTLTGFHGAHVAGGVLFMFVVLIRALGGQFSARHHEAVEACSFYWHFVDVVWIALFTTLYVFG